MEDIPQKPEKNPFEEKLGLRWYASRDGSSLSNFKHYVSPDEKQRFERIVLNQALEQTIRGIEIYLETKNEGATVIFTHSLVYMSDIIKDSYPEVYGLLMELHESVEFIGTENELDYKKILDELRKIKEQLNLNNEDYFNFAQEKGVSREKIARRCISEILPKMIPFKSSENILKLKEEWETSKNQSLNEFINKIKQLLEAVVESQKFWKFDVQFFVLSQTINDTINFKS